MGQANGGLAVRAYDTARPSRHCDQSKEEKAQWARHWPTRRAHCANRTSQLVAGRRPGAFSRRQHDRETGVLPMLSPFHTRNPCSARESLQTRNLGSYMLLIDGV